MHISFGAIDHIDRQDRPVHETYDSRLKLLQLYDKAGFSTFHVTEHHYTPLGLAPSPLIFFAAGSQLTQRIRFAPLVLIATLYNPLRLASEICMLDHLTKGRIDIGLGRGVSPYELAYFGVNYLESPALFRESVDVLMMALTKDVVNFRGNYFKFFGVPIDMRPYQKPHPPVWYATGATETTAWAATQNMNICFLAPTARTKVLVDTYKTAWTKQFGGSQQTMPKVGLTRHIYVGETDAQAMERGLFGYKGWFDKYSYLWAKHDPRPPGPFDAEVHRKGGRFIFGSPKTVRAELEREITETGINYFAARFAYGDLSHEESARSLELFTSEVMPHFQKTPPQRKPGLAER